MQNHFLEAVAWLDEMVDLLNFDVAIGQPRVHSGDVGHERLHTADAPAHGMEKDGLARE